MIHRLTSLTGTSKAQIIRLGVVGVALLALPVVGFLIVELPPILVLVALAAPFGLLAVVNRLELGLVAMLVAAVFVGFRIPTGTASEIVVSLVIAVGCLALWLTRMLVIEKRLVLHPAPVNVPLLGFMATVVVSLIWSRAFRDELVHELGHPLVAVAAGMVLILLPTTLLLVTNNVRSQKWLQASVGVLLGEGLIILFVDLGYALGVGPVATLRYLLSSNGFIHLNSHGLLSMWCLALALSLALFNRRLHWLWRGLLLAYAAGWVYWGFILRTSWLSGWLPAFIAASAVAFMRSKKLFLLLLIVAVVFAGGYYLRTSFESETEESGLTRLAAYAVNWRITGKHLLFGTGPAGYASYYMSYFPTEAMASHSNYIDIVAQVGVVGSFFFLWFFGAQVWGSYRLGRQLKGRGDFAESLSAAVLGGTIGCIVAMALGDWITPFAYTQGIIGFDLAMVNWFFMGSLWALHHTLLSPQKGRTGVDGASA